MKHVLIKPKVARTKVDFFNRFDGGLNLFISDIHLKDHEIPAMANVEPAEDGIVKTRYGYTRFGAEDTTPVTGLGGLSKDNGDKFLLKAGAALLKVYNESTEEWDDVTGITYTAGKKTDFCQAYNKTFIQNAEEDLSFFDGVNTVTQTNGQKGEFSIYFNGSLVTNDPLNPSRVYFSGIGVNIGDFSSGAGGEFIDINASDGDEIRGFGKYATGSSNVILVYKQHSTYKVRFDDSGLPVVEVVSPSRGAECHWTIDNMEDDIIFFSNLPALMTQGAQENFFNQIRTNELSLFVNQELERMNMQRKRNTVGIFRRHRYYFSYSGGGREVNDRILMFDKRYESWWYWDNINASAFMEWEDSNEDEHFLFGSDDGNVYEFDLSTTDNGGEIESWFETKAFNFDEFDRMKYFPFITCLFRNVVGSVKMSIYLDEQLSKAKTIKISVITSLAGFGATLFGGSMFGDDGRDCACIKENISAPRRVMLRKKGRTIKLKFESAGTKNFFSLLDLSIAWKKKSVRRFKSENIIR